MAGLDRTALDRVKHLQRRRELAGRVQADLEVIVSQLGNTLGEHFHGAVNRVQGFGVA